MKRTSGLALAALLGCCGFQPPTPEEVHEVLSRAPTPQGPFLRLKVRLAIEGPFLSGIFEGVIVAKTGPSPIVRAQFFPDIGGKVLDLLARPDRITGYFPMLNEGIDMSLPREARLHPLALIGVTLLEHFAPLRDSRVLGVRDGWYCLSAVVPGVDLTARFHSDFVVRKFRWIHGVSWEEESSPGGIVAVRNSRLDARMEILEKERLEKVPDALLELQLPPGTRGASR